MNEPLCVRWPTKDARTKTPGGAIVPHSWSRGDLLWIKCVRSRSGTGGNSVRPLRTSVVVTSDSNSGRGKRADE